MDIEESHSIRIMNPEVSSTIFGETVLANEEDLGRLPDIFYSCWKEYQQGDLPSVSREEVNYLLQSWFQNNLENISSLYSVKKNVSRNESSTQFPIYSEQSDSKLTTCDYHKRRRVDGDL